MSDLYLFRNTFRDLIRPGKLTAAALMIAVVLLLAVLMRASAKPGEFNPTQTYNTISGVFIFGFVLVILAVVFATGVIVQEIEQKTIPYLLTRPIPRWRILGAKYLAATAAVTATAWIADILAAAYLFGPAKLGATRLGQDMLILLVGAFAYSGLFVLLAALISRPLLVGLIYAFGYESWVPYLPGDWHKLSLMAYLHALAPHLDSGDAGAGAQALAPANIPLWAAWTIVLGVIGCGVVGAAIAFSVREYTPREESA